MQVTTGQDFARQRALVGVSARAVAAYLRVSPETLRIWEHGVTPLPAERVRLWQLALRHAGAERRTAYARQGIALGAVAPDDVLHAYRAVGWFKTGGVE